MNKTIAWIAVGTVISGLAVMALVGPGRLYGVMHAQKAQGQVTKIEPYGESESEIPAGHLVELRTTAGEIHVFATSDPKWTLVQDGDHVRSKLYPTPPWSSQSGGWQNAALVAKLAPPPEDKPATDTARE